MNKLDHNRKYLTKAHAVIRRWEESLINLPIPAPAVASDFIAKVKETELIGPLTVIEYEALISPALTHFFRAIGKDNVHIDFYRYWFDAAFLAMTSYSENIETSHCAVRT